MKVAPELIANSPSTKFAIEWPKTEMCILLKAFGWC